MHMGPPSHTRGVTQVHVAQGKEETAASSPRSTVAMISFSLKAFATAQLSSATIYYSVCVCVCVKERETGENNGER